MLARLEAISNAVVVSVPARVSRSRIFRMLNLAPIAAAFSGWAVPCGRAMAPQILRFQDTG
jgi:hypothetical protein